MRGGLLIADIGGTSSRWALCASDETVQWWPPEGTLLPGYNPLSGDGAAFRSAIHAHFGEEAPEALSAGRVIIYGAGCGSPDRAQRMHDAIAGIFPTATVDVHSDLLGAARSLFNGQQGLTLILGTGMNAGYYDGTDLKLPMPSLGWLLGDEGSGADLGRHLLRKVLYKELPEAVVGRLFGEDGVHLDDVLRQVHGGGSPALVLASHARRMASALDDPQVSAIVADRFRALAKVLARFFSPEERAEARATGSIAWAFQDALRISLQGEGVRLMAVERDPLPGLVRFHQRQVPA